MTTHIYLRQSSLPSERTLISVLQVKFLSLAYYDKCKMNVAFNFH